MDWLLGDDVAGLRTGAAGGKDSILPSWQLVLCYELEIREEAKRRMNMWKHVGGQRAACTPQR